MVKRDHAIESRDLGGCWRRGSGGAASSVLTTNACTWTPRRTGSAALECSSRDLHIIGRGAEVGTTSYSFITSTITPKTQPSVFPQNAGAVQALKNKQIDGLVVDLPTAFYAGRVERLEPSGLLRVMPTSGLGAGDADRPPTRTGVTVPADDKS
jgi:hypothetical protein